MGRISLADPQSLSWEECGTGSKKSCWREHCELICLSEVAKSLEAEEQAGYHQRAAYLCSFACLSFSSCFRAQSPCQCTNDNALFFFSDDYMILLSQHEDKTFGSLRLPYIFCPELRSWIHRMSLPAYRRNHSFGNVSLYFAIPTALLAKLQKFLERLWHKGRACSKNSFLLKCISLF